jgi:apolipoprotein N-acyltransferase
MNRLNIHLKLTLFAAVAGILLSLSWLPMWLLPLVFVGFVPLFYIINEVKKNELSAGFAFLYGFFAFLIFNVCTTWWVWNASKGGSVAAFVLNSLLMNLPYMVLFFTNKRSVGPLKIWPFIWAWLTFEYFHYRWDGTWTWLTLGNVFADQPWMVQWYEYTGVAGGTLWVLWVNKSVFKLVTSFNQLDKQQKGRHIFNLLFFQVFAVLFLSYYVLTDFRSSVNQSKRISAKVVVIQPNVDPYKDKFSGISPYQQTLNMLHLADSIMDSTVQLIAFPETALVGSLNERYLQQEETIFLMRQFLQKHPTVSILTGADSYKEYLEHEKVSETAREYDPGKFYDSYNTAMFIVPNDTTIGIYHKSKLVPGVERLPFSSVLKYVEKYAIDLGGTSGSLGISKEPVNFNVNSTLSVAPIICYESIFGQYITEYVKRNASLLCIITNDGWWGNTPGFKQHFAYARLRAIETRRYIARSANTGISGFITDEGAILQKSGWWVPTALKETVLLNNQLTFYVRNGDLINEAAVLFTCFILFGLLFKRNQLQ